jgi:hypothetical protein
MLLIVGGSEKDHGGLKMLEAIRSSWTKIGRYKLICGVSLSTYFVLCNSMTDRSSEVFPFDRCSNPWNQLRGVPGYSLNALSVGFSASIFIA